MFRLLMTGAAGRIGSALRPRLARPGRVLRLLDVAETQAGAAEEAVVADLTDPVAMASACSDVDAVVHLGAIPHEAPWDELLRVNIDGTRTVLEAARHAGVTRMVLASSIHAAGFYRRSDSDLPPDLLPRPDTYYGMSKAAVEALGSLYADRFGMAVFALRIGACFPSPPDAGTLDSWLSPEDCARLVEACLSTDARGFRVLWGISRNTRRWLSIAEGERIGYAPRDDSERYAASLVQSGPWDAAGDLIGRHFCLTPVGEWGPGRSGPPQR